MSLSDTEREILIQLHIEKAQSFLNQADEMRGLSHWDMAIAVTVFPHPISMSKAAPQLSGSPS